MITARLRVIFAHVFNPIAATLARMGVRPDMVTIAGTVGATASAVICFSQGYFFVGTFLVWFFVMLDGIDGALARVVGASRFGAVLDSSTDRLVDAAIFASIAWYYAFESPQRAMVAACLLCLILGMLTSYIKARAEGAGMSCNVGLAERTERLIIVLVGCGFTGWPLHVPYIQAITLWLLVILSGVTVGQRLGTVYRQARTAPA